MVWLKPIKLSGLSSPLWLLTRENEFFRFEKATLFERYRIVFKRNAKEKYVVALAETEAELHQ
jgi:hypothetical protein